MIKSIQKIIKVGNSGAVTIPAKDMKRSHMAVGDEVEVTIRILKNESNKALDAARQILEDYKQDFDNLAKR